MNVNSGKLGGLPPKPSSVVVGLDGFDVVEVEFLGLVCVVSVVEVAPSSAAVVVVSYLMGSSSALASSRKPNVRLQAPRTTTTATKRATGRSLERVRIPTVWRARDPTPRTLAARTADAPLASAVAPPPARERNVP